MEHTIKSVRLVNTLIIELEIVGKSKGLNFSAIVREMLYERLAQIKACNNNLK